MNKQSGFTLMELMVTIAIVGVLAVVGLPNLQDFLLNNRITSQTNSIVAALNYARGEAITLNEPVNLTANGEIDEANEWGQGWTIWVDNNNNENMDDEEIIREFKFQNTTTIDSNPNGLATNSLAKLNDTLKAKTLSYRGNGTLAVINFPVIFYICDHRTKETGRHVEINRTGRIQLADSQYKCD